MVETILSRVVPSAYALLPPAMASEAATAMLLAIGLQESRFQYRRQIGGPARGYWQFEQGGVKGVMTHTSSHATAQRVLSELHYPGAGKGAIVAAHVALEHNDVLACVFARLLLWTLPGELPASGQHEQAWQQYLSAWRPGKPHRETWDAFYTKAWALVSKEK